MEKGQLSNLQAAPSRVWSCERVGAVILLVAEYRLRLVSEATRDLDVDPRGRFTRTVENLDT